MRKSIVVSLATFLVSVAGVASASPSNTETELAARLKELYPSTRITAVRQSEVAGLFEVTMGRNVAFTDTSGRFFVFGHLFDMREQKDLTAQRLSDINRIDFTQLPLQDAIKTVRGDGSRMLAVFSDPDCPYCKGLESELAKLNNVSIFTFLYPLEGLHPEAKGKAERVWCAPNPAKAWTELMSTGKVAESPKCATPIERINQLANSLGINGTPMMILQDGSLIPGAAPAAEIDRRLAGHPATTKSAVTPRLKGN
jgi:thiol:disulfide interchange protein DsbC